MISVCQVLYQVDKIHHLGHLAPLLLLISHLFLPGYIQYINFHVLANWGFCKFCTRGFSFLDLQLKNYFAASRTCFIHSVRSSQHLVGAQCLCVNVIKSCTLMLLHLLQLHLLPCCFCLRKSCSFARINFLTIILSFLWVSCCNV